MAAQKPRESLLMVHEPLWSLGVRKGCREIEVKTGADSSFTGLGCRTLRIAHEDHGAHGGDGATSHALKDPSGCLLVPTPIVGVHDESTAAAPLIASAFRPAVHVFRTVSACLFGMRTHSLLQRSLGHEFMPFKIHYISTSEQADRCGIKGKLHRPKRVFPHIPL